MARRQVASDLSGPDVAADETAQQRLRPGPAPRNASKPAKLTISVPAHIAEEWRDAVFYLRRQGEPATLTGLIVDGVDRYLAPIRAANDGVVPSRGGRELAPGPLTR